MKHLWELGMTIFIGDSFPKFQWDCPPTQFILRLCLICIHWVCFIDKNTAAVSYTEPICSITRLDSIDSTQATPANL